MQEIFKDIPGYEGMYQVSNLGQVKSLRFNKIKLLSQNVSDTGYYRISISFNSKIKTFKTHMLMAITFLNHQPDGTHKLVVDHINNIRTDNRLENLQLITQRENASKDRKNGSSKYIGVYFHKQSKKWRSNIVIGNKKIFLGAFNNEIDAHKAYQNKLKEINNE